MWCVKWNDVTMSTCSRSYDVRWRCDVKIYSDVIWQTWYGLLSCDVMSGDKNSDVNVCIVILHTLQWWVVDVYDFVRSTAVERSAIQWNATANVQPHIMPNREWWFPTIPMVFLIAWTYLPRSYSSLIIQLFFPCDTTYNLSVIDRSPATLIWNWK